MTNGVKVIKSISVTDAILVSTDVPETDYPEWSDVVSYALGVRVVVPASHKVYQSLQDVNAGKDPLTESLWWVEVEPTNRWKMFDLSSTTTTSLGATAYYEFVPGQVVNAVGLLNLTGLMSVRVRLTDPDFGLQYDKTYELVSLPSESSWYAWFFDLRQKSNQLVIYDLPSYVNATLRIDIVTEGTGSVGVLTFGSQHAFGLGVNKGARLGIQDFSRKERNEWGDVVLTQRGFAKRASWSMDLDNSDLDNVYDLLSDLRATPCIWIGIERFRSTVIFGFYSNFEINIAYAMYSECSLDIEGLTQ